MSYRGSTEPRVFTPPLRELTPETTMGYLFRDFAHMCGVELVPWQEWLAMHLLEVHGDTGGEWRFRFRTVVVTVARQQGKTWFEKLLGLFFNYVLGAKLVIGTAQNLDNATETFEGAVELIEETPALAGHFVKALRGAGRREYQLDDGSRWKVLAASRKARGWSADLIMFDELREQRDWEAWSAVSKTMMARPNGLILCLSNAGDPRSVVLQHFRVMAHRSLGDPDGIAQQLDGLTAPEDGADVADGTMGYFEWSAPPGSSKHDMRALAQANPSLGYGLVTEQALTSAANTDPDEVFLPECMCIWVDSTTTPPFPGSSWKDGQDAESAVDKSCEPVFALDVDSDRTRAAIAVCGMRWDGLWHVEVAAYRTGTAWAVEWLRKRCAKHPTKVAIQGRGAPASGFADQLREVPGLELVEVMGRDLGAACGRFYDAVAACDPESGSDAVPVMHRPQPALDQAAQVAAKKSVGDGAFTFDRRNSPSDVSPLMACALAFGVASAVPGHARIENSYATRGVLVL